MYRVVGRVQLNHFGSQFESPLGPAVPGAYPTSQQVHQLQINTNVRLHYTLTKANRCASVYGRGGKVNIAVRAPCA